MFLTMCIHFDIAYDVGRLGIYTHNLRVEHWDAISRLLRGVDIGYNGTDKPIFDN